MTESEGQLLKRIDTSLGTLCLELTRESKQQTRVLTNIQEILDKLSKDIARLASSVSSIDRKST
jgi:hypothetical protein